MDTNEFTSMDLPLDWDSAFANDSSEVTHTESISDALILSLSNFGRVDVKYIMEITKETYSTVVKALKGSIFQNPDTWDEDIYKGWETAEEYLSGNLRRKLKIARTANREYFGRFKENIFAIRKILPESVGANDIYVTLGSPWVPPEIIEQFIAYILGISGKNDILVKHDEYTGTWDVHGAFFYSYYHAVASRAMYGTQRMDAVEIIERTLNMRTIAVYDEISSTLTKSGKKKVINKNETLLAIEKQQKILSEFQKWIWSDSKRKERLETIFDNKYGCVRRRIFDGSFLDFPGLSPNVQLYPYQKNAVARILFSPNTLLAHDVGSGKTYVMIAAGMELVRMGLSQKNLYVVPNNIVLQWKDFFESMYPSARVLCVETKSFTPAKRQKTLEEIKQGDWDAVIMAYSCFDRIPLSKQALMTELQEAVKQIERIESEANNRKKQTSAIRRKKAKLAEEIEKLQGSIDLSANSIFFDELGFTRMFVDEAHNYKNVPFETKIDKVLGISSAGSKKCQNMMDKVRFIQRQNNGGGVIMATGTPITNSLTDAFIMQKYLQSGELAMLDIQTFDSWVGMFAERVTEFEVDVDTNSYRLATRFSKFHNLPELTMLLSSIADFHQADEYMELPEFKGYDDTLIQRSHQFAKYLKSISSRADAVRKGRVNSKDDNMLKITIDGRKAALDLRLVEDNAAFSIESKVAKCADNAFYIYSATDAQKSTQLIFCDTSTPKAGFNIYDEVKRLLISKGMPADDIAFIHDAATEQQRSKLFAKVRSGEIRILVGSTFKLGMGVNVQDRLIAIHHLDVPWRPADMTQREGRILRQGNMNSRVYIYRYITEGSFDAYSWQLLETKQKFISDILEGSLSERSGYDVENTVLNYAEVKALAIGNPLIKERVEVANELSRVLALRRKDIEVHIKLEKELLLLPSKIERQADLVGKCLADIRHYRAQKMSFDKEERKENRERLAEAIREHIASKCEDEKVAMCYQGFEIVLPANMDSEKPYLWIRNEGKYYVELGESGMGAIIRVDNYLEKLSEHHQKMLSTLEALRARKSALAEEIEKNENYTERIEALKRKLEEIDKKLGVVK